jgi:uncharacterized protein YdaU (DUF1376 family)
VNYYIHHIGDYAEATSHLSLLEDGVYSRLLRKYYANEQSLPTNVAVIARQIGARTEEERAAVDAVLQDFFHLQEDGWHQGRCDAEIEVFRAKQAGNADAKENAKVRQRRAREHRKTLFAELRARGVVPPFTTTTPALAEILASLNKVALERFAGQHEPDACAEAPLELRITSDAPAVTRDGTGSPNSNHQTPITKDQIGVPLGIDAKEVPGGFLEFWKAWPKSQRKEARGKCLDVWQRHQYEQIAPQIVSHVSAKAATNWVEHGGKYVEAPLSYLNQRRWEGAELDGSGTAKPHSSRTARHAGLYHLDHNKGVNDDGSLASGSHEEAHGHGARSRAV